MDRAQDAEFLVDNFPAARRSLRIAYVTETWPPEINGVALSAARVVAGLQARNHDLQLIRPRQAATDRIAGADDVPGFHEVLMRGLPIPRYPNLRMGVPSRRALVRLWAHSRPDIVHVATEGPLGWSALQAAEQLHLPVSSDFRTNFHAYSRHYGVGWLYRPIMTYLRKFHQRTAVTMVPTEALKRDLESAGFRGLQVISRGVDTARFDPRHRSEALRAQWGVTRDEPVMVYVGRLAAEKNLDLVLAAWESARRIVPSTRLVLVGDGPLREELSRRHPEAIFAGQRQGEDLAAHYASGDLFVFASLTETFGNVTLEAMASGLPVLAYRHAAAAQLIRSGENGLLVNAADAQDFVQQAAALIGDAPRRARLGACARETATEQGWESIVSQFETILVDVVRSRGIGR